ncbi:hypothetical protein KGF54_002265 [Candida jiufengensis]|uniref:uncharacterized protein n=1 Tax=Candida jiufengensis TaxID=497108 RepID=UPI0022245DF7|nr:uncharacterized protein KGF54_002265 [Candida jiufengensis]KAI5954490.1 hypothetical protein KGF54_002265 [Candida jiufengensis]
MSNTVPKKKKGRPPKQDNSLLDSFTSSFQSNFKSTLNDNYNSSQTMKFKIPTTEKDNNSKTMDSPQSCPVLKYEFVEEEIDKSKVENCITNEEVDSSTSNSSQLIGKDISANSAGSNPKVSTFYNFGVDELKNRTIKSLLGELCYNDKDDGLTEEESSKDNNVSLYKKDLDEQLSMKMSASIIDENLLNASVEFNAAYHPLIKQFLSLEEIQEKIKESHPIIVAILKNPQIDHEFNKQVFNPEYLNKNFDVEKHKSFEHLLEVDDLGSIEDEDIPLSIQLMMKSIDPASRLMKFIIPDSLVDNLVKPKHYFKFDKSEFNSFLETVSRHHNWNLRDEKPYLYYNCERKGSPRDTYSKKSDTLSQREINSIKCGCEASIKVNIIDGIYHTTYNYVHNHHFFKKSNILSDKLRMPVKKWLVDCAVSGASWNMVHNVLPNKNFNTSISLLDQAFKIKYSDYQRVCNKLGIDLGKLDTDMRRSLLKWEVDGDLSILKKHDKENILTPYVTSHSKKKRRIMKTTAEFNEEADSNQDWEINEIDNSPSEAPCEDGDDPYSRNLQQEAITKHIHMIQLQAEHVLKNGTHDERLYFESSLKSFAFQNEKLVHHKSKSNRQKRHYLN